MAEVHQRLNALWSWFRRARPQATSLEVEEAARVIDARFKHWYHQPTVPSHVPYSLKEAEEAALKHLQQLFPELK